MRKSQVILIITCFMMLLQAFVIKASPLTFITKLEEGHEAAVPIIMYHVLSENPKNKWEITPQEFEDDLQYLIKNGYTTVFLQDLIDFVENGVALPERPIVLTFDDGRDSTMTKMLPLLQKYDAKASLAIIGAETDRYTQISIENKNIKKRPHLTWDDVNELLKSGHIEIFNHSYDLHGSTGAGQKKGESDDAYRARFLRDIGVFDEVLQKNTAITTRSFAYPLGIFNKISDTILSEAGYAISLTCRENTNSIRVGDSSSLLGMNRLLRPPRVTSEAFFEDKFVDE